MKNVFASASLAALCTLGSCGGGSSSSGAPAALASAPVIELNLTGTYTDPDTGELKGDPSGTATVEFDLEQPEGATASVVVEFSVDQGVSWNTANIQESLDGLGTPVSAPGTVAPSATSGATFAVTWNMAADIGAGNFAGGNESAGFPPVELRIVVVGGKPSPPAEEPVEVNLMGLPFPSEEAMGTARYDNASFVSNGTELMVFGGATAPGTTLAGGERGTRQDSVSDFVFAPAGSLSVARAGLTSTLLSDGRMLLIGGQNSFLPRAEVELFDPVDETLTLMASLLEARSGHRSVLLPNGQVAVIGGGSTGATGEIYDPIGNTWTGFALAHSYDDFMAVLLGDGRVLVAGCAPSSDTPVAEFLSLDVAGAVTATSATPPGAARHGATATVLLSGEVLLFGGSDLAGDQIQPVAELFDPLAGTYTPVTDANAAIPGYLAVGRWDHTATMVGSGNVLITGGRTSNSGGLLARTDYFQPTTQDFTPSGNLPGARSAHHVDRIDRGYLVISGGVSTSAGSELPEGGTATLIPPSGPDENPMTTVDSMVHVGAQGIILVNYTLTDVEQNDARITVEWSLTPAAPSSWRSATQKLTGGVPFGAGLGQLEALSGGSAHIFGWDYVADGVFDAGSPQDVSVRITPIGSAAGLPVVRSQILP
ncbi:MAG: hypothetical protein ACI8Q9_000722 [Planctomycetota bacterium]|jgi:hypothetical protein